MATIVYDLDHTVIDSSHRQLTRDDGSLDLIHWRENCTRDKIFLDTLLPLADIMRGSFRRGHTIIVCTARILTQHDLDYLAHHNLQYHHLLSRAVDDMRGDAEMKVSLLTNLVKSFGHNSLVEAKLMMYDDNLAVIKAMIRERVLCIDATKINRRLAA